MKPLILGILFVETITLHYKHYITKYLTIIGQIQMSNIKLIQLKVNVFKNFSYF